MVICLFHCVRNGVRGAKIATQVEQLTKQQAGLNQALQTAEQAYEQQVLTATRNELSTALSAKASSSQVDESQVVDSRNIPKLPVFDGKREIGNVGGTCL